MSRKKVKKLVLFLATSTSMTKARIKAVFIMTLRLKTTIFTFNNTTLLLERILYIYYLVLFKKGQTNIKALINFNNEVNIMTSTYTKKLDFQMQKTNVGAQKIDRSSLVTYKMVIAEF